MIITVQLAQGGEREIDVDQVTDWRTWCIPIERSSDAGFKVYVAGRKYYTIEIGNKEIYITPESLQEVISAINESKMKAPDKIYVPIVNLGVEDGKCLSPIWWKRDKTNEHPEVVGTAEFIRKDALVEFAKENFETCKTVGTRAMQKAFEELIDRIHSL